MRARDKRPWWKQFSDRLVIADALCIGVTLVTTHLVWFGATKAPVSIRHGEGHWWFNYVLISVVLGLVWWWSLALTDTRSHRVIGEGTTEYVRVIRASILLFGCVAILAYLTQVDIARGYLLMALPTGVTLLLIVRFACRLWLSRQRRQGKFTDRIVIVGTAESTSRLLTHLNTAQTLGYEIVGACLDRASAGTVVPSTKIPVLGTLTELDDVLDEANANTVLMSGTELLTAERVREISWGLEEGRAHLLLPMNIVDVAGPRLHVRPVSGLPLMQVETPRFTLGQAGAKRAIDVIASVVGVVLLSPILVTLAIMVRLSTPGPILFRQTRVGLRGGEFQMLKFRSMVVDAEERLSELQNLPRSEGNSVMFKMSDDPRVTKVGRFMRRYSLDELPQLFNVIGGSMSLVGPRPPLMSEIKEYGEHVHRRFLVKPGITGLWQVSGRSSLSWEQTVRLDLYYVENWSMSSDLLILMKTIRAVLKADGTF